MRISVAEGRQLRNVGAQRRHPGFTSSRMALPSISDRPRFSPSPVNACAAALSVRFTLTGSTFSAIEVTVSNKVLNSVVTEVASITMDGVIECAAG